MAKSEVSYLNNRVHIRLGQYHRYYVTIPELNIANIPFPSVTTIVGIQDKSGPLTQWAANCAALMLLQKLDQHIESVAASMPNPESVQADRIMVSQATVRSWHDDLRFRFRNVKKEAAEIGTLAHDYLEAHLKHVHLGMDQPRRPVAEGKITESMAEKANNSIDAALQWFTCHKLKLVSTEGMLASLEHGYAGRQDWKMYVDGELCNGDFKTGSGLYPEVFMQLAAYRQAEFEMSDHGVKASYAIHIDKETGEFTAVRRGDEHFASDLRGFLGLRQNWEWQQIQEGKTLPPTGIILAPAPLARRKAVTK